MRTDNTSPATFLTRQSGQDKSLSSLKPSGTSKKENPALSAELHALVQQLLLTDKTNEQREPRLAKVLRDLFQDAKFRTRFELMTEIRLLPAKKMPEAPRHPGELVVGGHLSNHQFETLKAYILGLSVTTDSHAFSLPDQQRLADEFLKIFSEKTLPELKEYRRQGYNHQSLNSDGLNDLVTSFKQMPDYAPAAVKGGGLPSDEVKLAQKDTENAAKILQQVLLQSWPALEARTDAAEIASISRALNGLIAGLNTAATGLSSAGSLFDSETWEQLESNQQAALVSDTVSVLLAGREANDAEQAKLQQQVEKAWQSAEPEVLSRISQLRKAGAETFITSTAEQLTTGDKEIKKAAVKAEAEAESLMNRLLDKKVAPAADVIRIVQAMKLVAIVLRDVHEVLEKSATAVKSVKIGNASAASDRPGVMQRLDDWAYKFVSHDIPHAPANLKAALLKIPHTLKVWDRLAQKPVDYMLDAMENISRGEGKLINTGKAMNHLVDGALNKGSIQTIRLQEKLSQTIEPDAQLRDRKQTEVALKRASVRSLANAQQIKQMSEQLLTAVLDAEKSVKRAAKLPAATAVAQVPQGDPVAMALRAVVETAAEQSAAPARKPSILARKSTLPDKAAAEESLKKSVGAAHKALEEVLSQAGGASLKQEMAEALRGLPAGSQPQAKRRFTALFAELAESESQLTAAAEQLKRAVQAAEQQNYTSASEIATKALRHASAVKRDIKHSVAAATGNQIHNFSTDGRIAKAIGEWANETITEFQQVFPEISADEIRAPMAEMLKAVLPLEFSKQQDPDGVLMAKRVDQAIEDVMKGIMLHPASTEQVLARTPQFLDYLGSWGVKKLSANVSLTSFSLMMSTAVIKQLVAVCPDLMKILLPKIGLIKAMLTPLTFLLAKKAMMQGVKPGQPKPDAEINKLLERMLYQAAFRAVLHVTPAALRNVLALTTAGIGLYRAEDRGDFLKKALSRLPTDFVYEGVFQAGRAAAIAAVAATNTDAIVTAETAEEAQQDEENVNEKRAGRNRRHGPETSEPVSRIVYPIPKDRTHRVKKGDTLEDISFRYYGHYHGTDEILKHNRLSMFSDLALEPGRRLVIPGGLRDGNNPVEVKEHRVMKGESLQHLAIRYYGHEEVGLKKIREANKILTGNNPIPEGTRLKIPDSIEPLAANRIYKIQPGDTLEDLSRKFYGHYHGGERIRQYNYRALDELSTLPPGVNVIIPGSLLDGKAPMEIAQHRVQAGDTLQSLGMKYYGEEEFGMKKILEANQSSIRGERISAGDVLKIPAPVDPQYLSNPVYNIPPTKESYARKFLLDIIESIPAKSRRPEDTPDQVVRIEHRKTGKVSSISLYDYTIGKVDANDYYVLSQDGKRRLISNLQERMNEAYRKELEKFAENQWLPDYVEYLVTKQMREIKWGAQVRLDVELNPKSFIRQHVQNIIDSVPERDRGPITSPDSKIKLKPIATGSIEIEVSLMDLACGRVKSWEYYVDWDKDISADLRFRLMPDQRTELPGTDQRKMQEHAAIPSGYVPDYIRRRKAGFDGLANRVMKAYEARWNALNADELKKKCLAKFYSTSFRNTAAELAKRPDLAHFKPQLEAYLSGKKNPKQMQLHGNVLREVVVLEQGNQYLAWSANGECRVIDITPEGLNKGENIKWIIKQMDANAQYKYRTESARREALQFERVRNEEGVISHTPFILTTMDNVGWDTLDVTMQQAKDDINSMITTAGEYLRDDFIDAGFFAAGVGVSLALPGAGIKLFIAQILISGGSSIIKDQLKIELSDSREKQEELSDAMVSNAVGSMLTTGAFGAAGKGLKAALKNANIKMDASKLSGVLKETRMAFLEEKTSDQLSGVLNEQLNGDAQPDEEAVETTSSNIPSETVTNENDRPDTSKPEVKKYKTQQGDTLCNIAYEFYGDSTKARAIYAANPQIFKNSAYSDSIADKRIKAGVEIIIPELPKEGVDVEYKMQKGESLEDISLKHYGHYYNVNKIIWANRDKYGVVNGKLQCKPGDVLRLPECPEDLKRPLKSKIHLVQKKDTLSSLALNYYDHLEVGVAKIKAANPGKFKGDKLTENTTLTIPDPVRSRYFRKNRLPAS